jgi:hypothetical protein
VVLNRKPRSKGQLGAPCHPSYVVQISLGKKGDLISKITILKRAAGMAEEVGS